MSQSAKQLAPAIETPGLRALPLVAPHRRLLTDLPRSMSDVDLGLAAAMRDLATGARPWPLFITGPVGAGKTLAALCLCDRVATAAYFTADGICSAVMPGADPGAVRDLWETLERKAIVVIDELGTRGNVSDFAYACIKRAVDARDQHAGRAAVYISNLTTKELAGLYDDRLASRLFCGTRFDLPGADRRLAT